MKIDGNLNFCSCPPITALTGKSCAPTSASYPVQLCVPSIEFSDVYEEDARVETGVAEGFAADAERGGGECALMIGVTDRG